MSDDQGKFDFEKYWQEKLNWAVESSTDPEILRMVLEGGEILTQESSPEDKIRWTCDMLGRLGEVTDSKTRQKIMTQCACQYPVEDLEDIKEAYQSSGDIGLVLSMMQEKFDGFLRYTLKLEDELIDEIFSRGWGLAGVQDGNSILATKIPKSGYLREYFQETDPEKKRRIYCHCPRVRDGVGLDPAPPMDYCYCGAGFYKGIWEEILGVPVEVEMVESVLQGGDVCKIRVHLPPP
jgi:hypothetical protein